MNWRIGAILVVAGLIGVVGVSTEQPQPPPAPATTSSDMGATYYWLEQQATRLTTRFPDGSAVAERLLDGDIRARLLDAAGNEIAQTTIERPSPASVSTAPPVTLDAAAQTLRKELPTETQTEFEGGIVAKTTRLGEPWPHLATTITRDGAEVGKLQWIPGMKHLGWSLPGLTQGHVNAASLVEIGGWPFEPTPVWLNIQGFAFYEFHNRVKAQRFVRQAPWKNWLRRGLEALVPTVYANEPGCDRLHWLDGSVFRPCCDQHDQCYQAYGCSEFSWFFWQGWRCYRCNMGAIWCFGTGGACLAVEGVIC